jgi:hypothetical protein
MFSVICPVHAEPPTKRLFIVHGYESGHICGQPQHDGVLKALAEAGWAAEANLVVEAYYMDTYLDRRNRCRGFQRHERAAGGLQPVLQFHEGSTATGT